MNSSCNRYLIIYNGEIYNKEFLKTKFKILDTDLKSNSDTEVLINGFASHGINFFNYVNGIYSFIILDKENNLLYFARDPLGIKPLYISNESNGITLSSEINPVLKIGKLFLKI